jgi:hypothetical protein
MKNPYEIESFKGVFDFPKRINKKYAKEALSIIERKIQQLKVDKLNAKIEGAKKHLESEIEKFEGFKSFVEKKLKEILDAEFEKLTGSKVKVEAKVEVKVETVEEPEETEETEETEEPKKTKKTRRTRRKKAEDKE